MASVGSSFQPRLRSFIISTTLTPEFFFKAAAKSEAVYTFLYSVVLLSATIPPPVFPLEKPFRS
ncbi:hypothetical protein D1872_264360 [compost metagenome]